MRSRLTLLPVLAIALGLLTSCGGGGGGGGALPGPATCIAGNGPPVTITGTILYERLTLTPGVGLSLPLITRAARFVDVQVRIAGGGTCYGQTSTDAGGAFNITVMPPAGSTLEVVAFSRTLNDGARDVFVHNALPPPTATHSTADAFSFVSGAFLGQGNPVVNFTVPYNPGTNDRPSIGFAVLDTVVTCWDKVAATPGVPLMPRVDTYTSLGNNFNLFGASFYDPGRQLLAILGGASGNLDNSDTDYFDESVVAHEFHHYVENRLAYAMTRGGFHSLSQLLFPAFAWSEGVASALGNLCIGTPDYVDSNGTSGGLFTQFDVDIIGGAHPVGIGSEATVVEVVYDLGDGGLGNPADTDTDNVGLPITDLYQALLTFSPATDAPYIGLFLDRLVGLSPGLSAIDVTTLLAGTGGDAHSQAISYPLTGPDVWPIPMAVPGIDNGTADSTFAVNKNQCNGIDSVIFYRLSIGAPQTVTINLTMTPTSGDGNLNLFLSANATPFVSLAQSINTGSTAEQIGPIALAAGEYIIRVEASGCTGAGVAATYTLSTN